MSQDWLSADFKVSRLVESHWTDEWSGIFAGMHGQEQLPLAERCSYITAFGERLPLIDHRKSPDDAEVLRLVMGIDLGWVDQVILHRAFELLNALLREADGDLQRVAYVLLQQDIRQQENRYARICLACVYYASDTGGAWPINEDYSPNLLTRKVSSMVA